MRTCRLDWRNELQPKAVERIDNDWGRMTAYYSYPKEHWTHLRTSNIVESPFASVRLRTEASRRYKKVEEVTAMIWKLLMIAERNFRRIKGSDLMIKVAEGVRYTDGVASNSERQPVDYKQAA